MKRLLFISLLCFSICGCAFNNKETRFFIMREVGEQGATVPEIAPIEVTTPPRVFGAKAMDVVKSKAGKAVKRIVLDTPCITESEIIITRKGDTEYRLVEVARIESNAVGKHKMVVENNSYEADHTGSGLPSMIKDLTAAYIAKKVTDTV